MNVTYRNNKIKKSLSSPTEIKKAYNQMAKKVQQRMDEIESSSNLEILMQIPAAKCHALKGDRKGQWAVDISGNFRLIFDLNHDPIPKKENGEIDTITVTEITIIDATDYH